MTARPCAGSGRVPVAAFVDTDYSDGLCPECGWRVRLDRPYRPNPAAPFGGATIASHGS